MATERLFSAHNRILSRFNRGAFAFRRKFEKIASGDNLTDFPRSKGKFYTFLYCKKPLIIFGLLLFFSGQGITVAKSFVPEALSPDATDFRTRVIIQIFLKTQNIHSLEDYARWLSKNIQYKNDPDGDRWARPEETLRRGFGDCEDLSFLNQAVLTGLEFQAHAVAFGRPGYGHAFCVFKINGVFAIFDNTQLILTHADSFSKIVEYVGQKEHPKYFLELSLHREEVKFFYFKESGG